MNKKTGDYLFLKSKTEKESRNLAVEETIIPLIEKLLNYFNSLQVFRYIKSKAKQASSIHQIIQI